MTQRVQKTKIRFPKANRSRTSSFPKGITQRTFKKSTAGAHTGARWNQVPLRGPSTSRLDVQIGIGEGGNAERTTAFFIRSGIARLCRAGHVRPNLESIEAGTDSNGEEAGSVLVLVAGAEFLPGADPPARSGIQIRQLLH